MRTLITVNNKMQTGYTYELTEPEGQNFAPDFTPALSPKEMLAMGVFEGKYLNDCKGEYPASWFKDAKLSPAAPDTECNFFRVKSRLPLSEWRRKGWIIEPDVRGWFEWYCRYFLGRRLPALDAWQIKRWRAFARHKGQIQKHCHAGDIMCRPRQRQALLQWAYNPLI